MAYDHNLLDDEKRELLRIARATLREFVRTGMIPPGKPHRESMLLNGGAFVTIEIEEQLRGCMGNVEPNKPLYKTIQEMAVAAASRDPRFPPIREEELLSLSLEISVLGETKGISTPEEVEIGVHGLSVEKGDSRGFLLPQVASKRDWDGITFLAQVCSKAGIPEDSWKEDDTKVEAFVAQVFSDQSHPAL